MNNYFQPNKCYICGEVVKGRPFCDDCAESLKYVNTVVINRLMKRATSSGKQIKRFKPMLEEEWLDINGT